MALLHKESEMIFSSLTLKDLPEFTSSAAFQELLASIGAFSAELVAGSPICSAEKLVAFEAMAAEAKRDAEDAKPTRKASEDKSTRPNGLPALQQPAGGAAARKQASFAPEPTGVSQSQLQQDLRA